MIPGGIVALILSGGDVHAYSLTVLITANVILYATATYLVEKGRKRRRNWLAVPIFPQLATSESDGRSCSSRRRGTPARRSARDRSRRRNAPRHRPDPC